MENISQLEINNKSILEEVGKLVVSTMKCGDGGALVARSCPTLVTPWTVACQAPLSMRFPRQEYWSGLPFPAPGDIPNPRIEPQSPALRADSYTASGFFTNWAMRDVTTECRGRKFYKIKSLKIKGEVNHVSCGYDDLY